MTYTQNWMVLWRSDSSNVGIVDTKYGLDPQNVAHAGPILRY